MLAPPNRWQTLAQIARFCQCSECSASARLRELRSIGYIVQRQPLEGFPHLFAYRVVEPPKVVARNATQEQIGLFEGRKGEAP